MSYDAAQYREDGNSLPGTAGWLFKVTLGKEYVRTASLSTHSPRRLTEFIPENTLRDFCVDESRTANRRIRIVESATDGTLVLLVAHALAIESTVSRSWIVEVTPLSELLSELFPEGSLQRDAKKHLEKLPLSAVFVNMEEEVELLNDRALAFLRGVTDSVIGARFAVLLRDPVDVESFLQEHKPQKLNLDHDLFNVPVLAISEPLSFADGDGWLVLFHEEEGRPPMDAEAILFDTLAEYTESSILLVNKSDGSVSDLNGHAATVLAQPRESIIGETITKLTVLPSEFEGLKAAISEKGQLEAYDLHVRTGTGKEVRVEMSAEEITYGGDPHLLLIGQDKTAAGKRDSLNLEGQEAANKIFHSSPAPILITRESDGMILQANEAMSDITGIPVSEIINKTTVEVNIWETAEDRTELLRRLQHEGPLHDFQMKVKHADGREKSVLFSVQRIRMYGQNCLLSVGTDITSREEAKKKLEAAKAHAEEMARFRTAMLSNLTHEVRTPLTVILGFTTMLRQGVREEYSRFVDLIERSGRRLLLTLDSMLDLAQLEAGTLDVSPEVYNIADLISGSVEDLRPRAKKHGITLDAEIEDSSAYVEIDFDAFKRALEHVLDNAIKFTDRGSITLSLETSDSEAVLHIQDTGIGIGEDFIPHVFDAFKQESTGLERSYQGSGLGLTVAKSLIEYFDGTLSVCSEKGTGSTFTITLPQSERKASRLAA